MAAKRKKSAGKPRVKVISKQHTAKEVFETPHGENTFEPVKEQQTSDERQEYGRRREREHRQGFWARLLGR